MVKHEHDDRKTIVLIGHGMVGHRFCERMVAYDLDRKYRIVTFCEEPRAAYDRVGLTSFFTHRDAEQLMLARLEWYRQQGIDLHVGDRASQIDRKRKIVRSDKGCEIHYDQVVFATGSFPFVPPMDGVKKQGVFVYRTIEDLQRIIAYSENAKTAVVLGGGLLGLEAAKAASDLGLKTHVVEHAPRLMNRQLDEAGSRLLLKRIEELGVRVWLGMQTKEILGNGKVEALLFGDGTRLDADMIIVSAGIRPRDEMARECGIDVGERGGIVVDDALRTSDPDCFAVGEVALHKTMVYGLVAPGYEMADTLAANFCGESRRFTGGDLSAKLKLMGVDVASFGDYTAGAERSRSLAFEDPFTGVYKKLVFDLDGTRLLGGILVGDASDYGRLKSFVRERMPLPGSPSSLIHVGSAPVSGNVDAVAETAQICSCNNVTKAEICAAIRGQNLETLAAVKTCTKAGTGCGGCLPMVTDIFKVEMKRSGKALTNHLCEHFALSRQELFQVVKIKRHRTFDEVLKAEGRGGYGCEVCKPAVASVLASLWNEHIVDHATIQDTNDRFLANVQRQGLYSVVPRIPGGEITPEKLIALGKVASKYNLYTKITGAQRIDLFGARVNQLPDIWAELVEAGFESGHAYGKALRTVKSCVGTTWCRFGVQDSVGFAIRIENRYKGIRAPHKLKSAVSGCTRECAEAQSKDFGLIATEKGWNLYVCGNGGTKPRHADLLASDLDEDTAIQYIDRFLMYYIHTADRLTRTSVWLDKMEGGIDYLRNVVVNDTLGLAASLEAEMEALVQSFKCEWKEVVDNPSKRALFSHYANSEKEDESISFVDQRGQYRPSDWTTHSASVVATTDGTAAENPIPGSRWIPVGQEAGWPHDGGAAIRYGHHQIAVYKFSSQGKWYACQNMCPHKRDMVLSRGMLGSEKETPKVACPMHKKTFCLETGRGLSDPQYHIQTFPVKIVDGGVFVLLPPLDFLDDMDMKGRESAHCATNVSCV